MMGERKMLARHRCPALLALALTLACAPAEKREEIRQLERASFQAAPFAPSAPAEQVMLPHRAPGTGAGSTRHARYRLAFDLDALPREPWAVYLPQARMNPVVRLNDRRIGDGGSTGEPVARNWNRPLRFEIERGSLRVGRNQLTLDLYASPTSELRLAPVRVGPQRLLGPIHDRAHWRQITIREASVGFLAVIALATTLLAMLGAIPLHSLWLAATAAFIGVGQLDGFVRDIPMSTRAWQVLNIASYLAGAVCFVASLHRLIDRPMSRFEFRLAIGATLLALATVLASPAKFGFIAGAALWSSALVLAYTLWRGYHEGTGSIRAGIAIFSASLLLLGGIDAAYVALVGPLAGPRAVGFLPIVVSGFMGWMLLENLRQILDRNDRLNAELDRRIARSERDLAASHARIRDMERSEALTGERGRLVREMHDGLGSLLVSTLAMVEGGEPRGPVIADALREVLEEMRLMLDSLEPDENDFAALLGRLRTRLTPRLERAGISVDWQLPHAARLAPVDPLALHHVMRIVQEAIGNVIRHAGAGWLYVRVRADEPGEIVLEVEDDGRGFETATAAHSRRGIANMRKRAEEIGGRLEIEAGARGTCVRLSMPIDPA